jgi:hypothetical protein
MTLDQKTLFWLAGLLEAEGSFIAPPPSSPNTPLISVSMTDEDIISRVAAIFGVKYQRSHPKNKQYKTAYVTRLKGYRAADMMGELYPLMSKRRQKQIERALENYIYKPNKKGENNGQSKLTELQVREIKIRLIKGEVGWQIAKEYNISRRAISDINCGKTWSHIKV